MKAISHLSPPADPDILTINHEPVPLSISDGALAHVVEVLAEEGDPKALGLRVAITGTRGAEYAYDLSFEELAEAGEDDLVYKQGDLTVMVPADSVDPLWGATLDLPSTPGQGGLVIRNPNRPDPLGGMEVELSGTLVERVEQLLDQQINPALASHGGFASLVEIVEGGEGEGAKAKIIMGGGCQGCAVSAVTLRNGIRASILQYIPEIIEVIDATDHEAGSNPYFS